MGPSRSHRRHSDHGVRKESRSLSHRSLTRRRLLKTSAAAALVAPAIVPSSVLGQDAPSDKITVGFIGTGNNGTNWIQRFVKDRRVRVVAVCDVNREGPGYWQGTVRGREPARRMVDAFYNARGCAAYEDFRELIARDDIDAIYIGAPDHWHAVMAITAAKAGKDIYGQKPLSLTVAEGRAMVKAVEEAGVVWQTGSQQRSDWNFRRVCELVRNGRIGKLQTVRCGLPGGTPDYGKTAHLTETQPVPEGLDYDLWLGPAPEEPYCPARVGVNFRWVLNYSGGQVTDWGGHHLDIAQWGMDTESTGPIAIQNAKGKFAEGPIYDTATEFHFECVYENGVKLIVSNEERLGVTFEGDDGRLWVDRGTHEASAPAIQESRIGKDEIHLYESLDHVGNFIDCVRSRANTVAPIETAHRSITIAQLGNIAMLQGRDLKWDPKAEQILGDPGANDMLSYKYRKPWVL